MTDYPAMSVDIVTTPIEGKDPTTMNTVKEPTLVDESNEPRQDADRPETPPIEPKAKFNPSTALKKWYATTGRKEITIVTAGRSGAGKSTLIHNMMRLMKVDEEAEEVVEEVAACDTEKLILSPSSSTCEVKLFTSQREEGGELKMFDTPDFTISNDVDAPKAMAELQEMTEGKCDALLYCVSLLPDSKIDAFHEKMIKKLTHVFGEGMWKRTILVLTFANAVKVLYPQQSIETLVNEYAKKFESLIKRVCPSISVVSIFSEQTQWCPSTIVALPAGNTPDEQYIDGEITTGWDESIYLEVLRKNDTQDSPIVFKAHQHILPIYVRIPILFGGFVIAAGVQTAIGTATCVYITTTIGRFFEQIVGCSDLMSEFDAQRIGLPIGLFVVGSWATIQVMPTLQTYEREQFELEVVQREVKQLRKKKPTPPIETAV